MASLKQLDRGAPVEGSQDSNGLNLDVIPRNLTLSGVAVDENDVANNFAQYPAVVA